MTKEEKEIFDNFQEKFLASLTTSEKRIYTKLFIKAKSFPFLENNIENFELLLSFQEILDNKAPKVLRELAEESLKEEKKLLSKEEYEIALNEEIEYLEMSIFEISEYSTKSKNYKY